MQFGEGKLGRVFVLRLEDGERLPDAVEDFARQKEIRSAMVMYLGGADDGSRVIVGPEAGRQDDAIVPVVYMLKGIQEALAVGTLFPGESGEPVLHMHAATGRDGGATVGCTRAGLNVWLVGEVVLFEILGTEGERKKDSRAGFQLLQFPGSS
jgi:predicted DNA-binding protein with PD1-like motif